ncbi:hypothetical protein ACHHYP_10328 [Achlya hypogyna]|uniref:SAM domain-containing protein n=1 Tax=Achlya hypogyna TaxID=1202772 RepID=A0A1V9YLS8_ACHHY|nr:hypothetical protein ACHHYP_10328 [Achlya hypogyna]
MGAGASVSSSETFDKAQCKAVCDDLFDEAMWVAHADKESQTITGEKLQTILSSLTDVFLTHDWGTDGSNHRKVSVINGLLRDRGGNIKMKMISGIENARCIVVFVTQRYMEKVGGDNGEDNCQLEFNFAARRKTNMKMISVLMDPSPFMKDCRNWTGPVGMTLGGALYIDFSNVMDNPDLLAARMDDLMAKLTTIIGKPLKERFSAVAAQETVPLELLSKDQVSLLLTALEYSKYCDAFLQNEINGAALMGLTSVDEVKEIGVTLAVKAKALFDKILDFQAHGVPKPLLREKPKPKPKPEPVHAPLPYFVPPPIEAHHSAPSGAIRIVSVKSPDRCIQLEHGDNNFYNGKRCQLWELRDGSCPAQEWIYDGKLLKLASDSSRCIHLQSGQGPTSNGDVCHLWDVQPGHYPAQEWIIDGHLIRSAKDPNRCIHLQCGQGAAFSGDACHLWDVQHGPYPAQEWMFIPLAVPCRIHSVKMPEWCIQLESGGNGGRCKLYPAHGGSHPPQEWIYDGRFIKSVLEPHRCIHLVSGAGPTYNGDYIQLWDIQPGHYPAQEWLLDGKFLKSAKDQYRCVHLQSGTAPTHPGDVCHLWDIQQGHYSPQEWEFVPQVSMALPLPTMPFMLQSVKCPTKCIHLQSGMGPSHNGDRCHLWSTQDGAYPAQEWLFDGKLLRSAKDPSKCIHLMSGSGESTNGDICHLWDVQPGSYPAQEWIIDGKLIRSAKCPSKCIHLKSGSTRGNFAADVSFNGDVCHLWDVQEGPYPAQEWTIVYMTTPAPDTVPLKSLTTAQVYQLLSGLEFSNYKQEFLDLEINGHALSCCDRVEELHELGVTLSLKAKSLFRTLQELQVHGVPSAFFASEALPPTTCRIQSVKCPTKCMHLKSGDGNPTYNGDPCHLWDTQRGDYASQTWLFDGKLIKSAKDPTKCIHLRSGTAPSENGDVCHLWDIQEGKYPAQEWYYDGKRIRSVKCPNKCIHLQSGSSSNSPNGDVCHLWDVIDGPYPAQEWTLVKYR